MLKKCAICKKQFNAIKSTITCSNICSKLNKLLWDKKYRQKHPEYMKKWEKTHKKFRKEYCKKYYLTNKKILNQKRKLSYQKNKRKELFLNKLWIKNNHNKRRNQKKNYYNRKKTDIKFRILVNLRSQINRFVKFPIKYNSTMKLVGCSIKQLKQHLESHFTNGMNWNNYGTGWNGKGMKEWHIDHIRPCASFDLSKSSEQRKCFHYTNLQPLWAKENLSKGAK